MAAFEDAKMEQFKDRPWNSLPENLDEVNPQITTGATKEVSLSYQESSSMKLKKEDMMLYGLCPAQDEFFLAICERCKLLVKPQALKTHIAIRHSITEDRNSKISLPKTSNYTLNCYNQSELFKNPKDYMGTKSQQSTPSRYQTSRHSKRAIAFVKDSNDLIKNSKISVTSNKNSCMIRNASVKEDLLPTLLGTTGHLEKRLSSVLHEKPYVDIARMDSEIMNLMSAMEESSSNDAKTSDIVVSNGNDSQPPKLEPMIRFESHEKMDPQKISVSNYKLFSSPQLELTNSLAKKLHTASILLANKNGKLPSTASIEDKINSSSELKALSQPLIQLNLQNLRPLLSKTVIAHPSILAIKTSNPSIRPSAMTLSTTSTSSLPNLLHASSLLIQKSPTSTIAMAATNSFQQPKTILTKNKSYQSAVSSGRSSKKKGGNPDFALCKNRQYNPDKHCGVLITETQKPCTRFLTCKTHPLLLRRNVNGRSKPFDELLREQREKRQALARGDAAEKDIQTILPILKIDNISRTCSTDVKSLFATNKKGQVLLAACSNKLHPKPLLPLNPIGNSDPLLKLLPEQSPMEDVFSGLLSPSGMLLSPRGIGLPLFSPQSSGNFENFTKLKCELTEEIDLRLKTSECTMPSLIPFEMKEEDLSWHDNKFSLSPSCNALGQLEMNRLVMQQSFKTYSNSYSGGSIDDEDCDEVFSFTRDGLEVMDHHPRPIAINHFNSSLYGDGNYVYTRRGDACRVALMSAVESEAVSTEPPKKRLCLDSMISKSSKTNDNQQSGNLSQLQSLEIHLSQHDLSHEISLLSPKISDIKPSASNPSLVAIDTPSQPRSLEMRGTSMSLPSNVTLTRSSLIMTPKSSSSPLLISSSIKKQISLTPLNISQITASFKPNNNQVSITSATTTPSRGGHMVHLSFPNSGMARSLFTHSSPITLALPINKSHAQSIAISKGAGAILVQPASQLPMLSPPATVILAPSKGMNQSNIITNFAIQNSPDTILQLMPRVQNGSRMAKKPTPIILSNKNKIGSMDLVGLGLRAPNIVLSSSGDSLSSSCSSLSSLTSVVNFSNSGINKSSGQMQNLVLRLPNGISETSKNLPDSIIRVPTISTNSSVVAVTSVPDRPINSVLLINNKRLALSSTSAIHPSTHQSINISSDQRNPSSSSNSVLLWGVNHQHANIMTLQQPQRLQRFQLITNQSETATANHIKEPPKQVTRLNGIALSGNSAHILLGIPQKRQGSFSPRGQLILNDLEEFGELQTEGEIPPHFSSPHRMFIKGGNTSNTL